MKSEHEIIKKLAKIEDTFKPFQKEWGMLTAQHLGGEIVALKWVLDKGEIV